jgi:hypothetical protein
MPKIMIPTTPKIKTILADRGGVILIVGFSFEKYIILMTLA